MQVLKKRKIKKVIYQPYCDAIGKPACFKVLEEAKKHTGKRIVHINATPEGGGVVEILKQLVPLTKSLGIDCDWYYLNVPKAFFKVSRKLHDLAQGEKNALTNSEKQLYLNTNKKIARAIDAIDADIFFLHDPQPLAAASFVKKHDGRTFISVLHIDLTSPNKNLLAFLLPLFKPYKKIFVSLPQYLNIASVRKKRVVAPVAIDPLSKKNKTLGESKARKIVKTFAIDPDKPLLLRVLRFDPWKDPFSTIYMHQNLQKIFPDLQTVIMGFNLAQDDAKAAETYAKAKKQAAGNTGLKLLYNPKDARGYDIDTLVAAFLETATVFEHKAIREGFGLVVTEAMWKGVSVVGGNVGGVAYQIQHGKNGYLVKNRIEAEQYITRLLVDEKLRAKIGKAAHMRVRKNFLLPRLLYDYLSVLHK